MGRLLIKIAMGVAAVLVLFWLLSIVIGLLVWIVMIAAVVGVVWLGVKMLRSDAGARR
ncbi:hypothetical protein [Nocardiopsis sp. NRRL B-16309]|uniref:hypothetical protein n=1 Tax=Nocardiopsis sp. NRRL B-16309 TaxID=1519494 RepID=UPI0006C14004|nr:hypothetical protein [Nocardiopsis sp. NRRL B-16309]KOX07833.1 membrane protein [Nocardiopsis sp. NRRL B-16309]